MLSKYNIHKCISIFKFIPIGIILLFFIKEKDDICNHTKNTCISLLGSFFIFLILYILFVKCDANKWISIIISILLWIIFIVFKEKLCSFS